MVDKNFPDRVCADFVVLDIVQTQDQQLIAGVCGGIAEYAGIDPTVVRLVLVVLTLASGVFPLLIAYLVAWVIMPTPQSS